MTSPTSRSVVAQACPNCSKLHDVSIYVSGQQVTCSCGIKFEVRRNDVKKPGLTIAGRPETPGFEKTVASSDHPAAEGESTSVTVAPLVPGFELVELLGKGGMGEVWKARQISLSRLVAVKVLPSRFAKDREFVARFDKEANALASLSHPGVVQIIDRGQAGEHYYFVMELVPGINLREMMNAARLTLRDALRIGAQVARAIDYAHEMKIVHRDLKPENVLIDARGHVKIADFGLAGMKGTERDISLTATAVAMGTVNYMAPEQRRDAKNVDHRADLYSLGVLLYEMFTGELPIGRYKLPSQRAPGLDPRVDDVIGHLLESDPAARPARANLVAEVLEAVTPGSSGSQPSALVPASTQTPVPSRALQTGSFIQQPGGGWRLGVYVLGAMLCLGLGLKFWPESGKTAATEPPGWYHDGDETEPDLWSTAKVEGTARTLTFDGLAPDAGERINPHSGLWELKNGQLNAVQYGESLDDVRLVPRAYVSDRYFLADRFEASVDMEVSKLGDEFPPIDPKSDQHFAELAFRLRDLQVSAFAIPGDGVTLRWSYFKKDGQPEEGNSGTSIDGLKGDPVRVPARKFRMRMRFSPLKNGDLTAEVWVDKERVTRQVLPGMAGQVGKLSLGCRNQNCRFDNLTWSGQQTAKPDRPD